MKFEKFKIDLLDTGIFGLDGGAMFGVIPKALWSKAYHPGDELNRIPLAARPLLVRWEDRVLLIDTGNGTKMNQKLASIYNIDMKKSSIVDALGKFGINKEDITDVILTHLHFDHAGGSTLINNDKIEPSFPNAKYYIQKKQLDWALNPVEKDRGSFIKENFEPLLREGLLETLDGNGELFQGISVMPLNGHTSSMQIVIIGDGSRKLIYAADLCPTSAHIPIPYVMGYDNYPLVSIEEKKKLWKISYESNSIIIFEHDAFTQAATIAATGNSYVVGEKIIVSDENYELVTT